MGMTAGLATVPTRAAGDLAMDFTILPAQGCQSGQLAYGLGHPLHAQVLCRSCDSVSWCWRTDRAVEEGCAQCDDVAGAEAGQLGALADADDAAIDDPDRGIGHDAKRIARNRDHRRDVTVGKQAVPHRVRPLGRGIGRERC